jgi:hypothetical protein
MANPSGRKGSSHETSLLPALLPYHPYAIRNPAQGAKDKGDFYMPGNHLYVVEAKNVRTMSLGVWVDEAEVEAKNAEVSFGVVFHKRAWVTDSNRQFATMLVGSWLALVHRDH